MKRRRQPPRGQAVNITPLSDIMLSLLIFFMLVSKAGIDTGADNELQLPIATLGVTEDQFEEERANTSFLVVNVESSLVDGNPRVYGKYLVSGETWSFNVDDLNTQAPTLQRFIEDFKDGRDDFQVYIHAGRNTPYFDTESVLRAVSRAGVAGVQYAFVQPN
ncbi:MAG: biopolymer transporter ExbD [Planctomycetota bacterium]